MRTNEKSKYTIEKLAIMLHELGDKVNDLGKYVEDFRVGSCWNFTHRINRAAGGAHAVLEKLVSEVGQLSQKMPSFMNKLTSVDEYIQNISQLSDEFNMLLVTGDEYEEFSLSDSLKCCIDRVYREEPELQPSFFIYDAGDEIGELYSTLSRERKTHFHDETWVEMIRSRMEESVFGELLCNMLRYGRGDKGRRIAFFIKPDEFIINFENYCSKCRDERVFVPTFRDDDAIAIYKSGTGMGLHVARSCVMPDGGSLQLLKPEKNGDVFSFVISLVLPRKRVQQKKQAEEVTVSNNIRPMPNRILWVSNADEHYCSLLKAIESNTLFELISTDNFNSAEQELKHRDMDHFKAVVFASHQDEAEDDYKENKEKIVKFLECCSEKVGYAMPMVLGDGFDLLSFLNTLAGEYDGDLFKIRPQLMKETEHINFCDFIAETIKGIRRILWLEDSPKDFRKYSTALTELNLPIKITRAEDILSAETQLNRDFDLLISDMNMEKGQKVPGTEKFLQTVNQNFPKLRIIILSGYGKMIMSEKISELEELMEGRLIIKSKSGYSPNYFAGFVKDELFPKPVETTHRSSPLK